jgi:hypothetical protein
MGLKIKTGKRFLRGFSSPALDPMKVESALQKVARIAFSNVISTKMQVESLTRHSILTISDKRSEQKQG